MEVVKPLSIEVDYADTLNYAMVLNGIPFLRKITVTNQSDRDLKQLIISVSFQENIAKSFRRTLDVLPIGLEVDLGQITVELNPEYLFHLTEAMTALMKIEISEEGTVLMEETREVHVLSYNEWQGMDTMPEVLTAFVTPNHPAIDNILVEASHILKESGKDPSFEGYQKGDINRVREQVHAIFMALKNQEITYIGPPASFVARGQRVRLSSEVLEKKMGTCLDLTLLFASCLEAVSIHPLIILIKGHSFLGYWQEEEFFQDTVEYDATSLTKRSAEGMSIIGVLETTDIRSGQNLSFTQSEEHALSHLRNEEDFLLSIDMKRARVGGIRPLPERLLVNGQYVQRKEQSLEERTNELPELKEVVKLVEEKPEKVLDRKTLWERKLLDLSLRNSLLNYVPGRKGIELLVKDLHALEDMLYEGMEFQVLSRVSDHENREGEILSRAADYFTAYGPLLEGEFQQRKLRTLMEDENLEKKLTRMYRDARTHLEESGANSLFLTMGVLKWYENSRSSKERYAPLLLIPVEMKKKVGRNAYTISAREEDTLVNITLLEKLKQDFDLEITGLSDLPLDEKGVDVMKVLSIVRNAVLSQKRWDVLDEVHLGLFSFSRFIMWNDIRNHGEDLKRNKVIRSLMEGKLTFEPEKILKDQIMLDEVISPSEILLPVSTDASQLQAVDAAVKGKSFVLHGPPGTGKSQTITTIIANALYQGKRVLFVAEKMAALSVVQRRLEGLGLGHFSLEVHSNKSKKTHILKKLEETTKIISRGEVDFEGEALKLKELRGELNEVVGALYRSYGFDLSAYELMGKLEYLESAPEIEGLDIRYEALTRDQMEELFLLGRELRSIAETIGEYADAPLKGIGITDYTFDLKSQMEKEIDQLKEKAEKLGSLTDVLMNELSLKDLSVKSKLDAVHGLLTKLEETSLSRELIFHEDGYRLDLLENAALLAEKKEQLEESLLSEYESSLFLLNEKELRDTFLKAEEKFILLRGMTRKKVTRVLSAQRRGNEVTEEETLPLLNQMEEKRKLESSLDEILSGLGISDRPISSALEGKTSVHLRRIMGELESFRSLFRQLDLKGEEKALMVFKEIRKETSQAFLQAYSIFEKDYTTLKEKLSLDVETLPGLEGNWAYRFFDRLTTYGYNLEALREWTTYNRLIEKAKKKELMPMIRAYEDGTLCGKDAEEALMKSLYKGAFLYILSKEPLLQAVTGRQFKEKIVYFREVTEKYENLAKREIQHVLASRVPNMMKEANGSSEVGILQRAIRSGGRGMTLRSLFDRLPNLLPRITPCMLMSPLSVAQYLGTSREYFDLVIFDEASQMPTAESVGAMARGKEVVIVGDPKQLPPTTFFSTASGKVEEEDGVMEDLDNILEDALALSMPETSLLWHYRSRHESLIAYSNRTYYDNDLYTYPSPGELKSKVSYQYVEAAYGRGGTRANPKEAEAVVAEIMMRLQDEKRRDDSIGVVTFSMAQKDMIEDTLSEALKNYPEIEERILAMDEPVFVKNLENVQGDERDVILFSIGYGPDEEGKITLNFGPLNRENGWKRLNVAITRSKKEMKIFTSIRPEMMDTSRTSSQGIHDLKGFLDYARRGSQPADLKEVKSRVQKDTLADAIRKELLAKGLQVDIRVGASKYKVDLAVVNEEKPEEYLLGILCQGESYRNAKSARDRDILQEMVLEGLGWNLLKVYPMDWMENSQQEVERILEKVREIRSGAMTTEERAKSQDLGIGNLISQEEKPEESREEDGISRAYVQAEFDHRPMSAEEFRMPKNTRDIKDTLMKIIHLEAPITLNLLYRQTLKAFGVRYTQKSVDTIDTILSGLGYEIVEREGQYFIYGEEKDSGVNFYRYATREMKREAEDLPMEEIQLAIQDVVEKQVSIPEESLVTEVLKLFGYARGNEKLEEKVRQILHNTSEEPMMKEENGNFTARI